LDQRAVDVAEAEEAEVVDLNISPQGLKARNKNRSVIAAVNRCATQNQ
jgi:hypothetical protein